MSIACDFVSRGPAAGMADGARTSATAIVATGATTARLRARFIELSAPKRPELVPDEVERCDEDDRDRRRDDLPEADPVEEDEQPELVRAERDRGDDEEPHALRAEVALRLDERPVAVPPVVVRGGDDEGDCSRDVRPQPEQQGVERDVDDVTGKPDHAELGELDPVVRAPERLDRAVFEHSQPSRGYPIGLPAPVGAALPGG